MNKLTNKQSMFVSEYIIDFNATQAAIRAGYSENSAQEIGSQNLSKLIVWEAIQEEIIKRKSKMDVTVEEIVNDLKTIKTATLSTDPRSALKALELLGKYKAMFTDVQVNKEDDFKVNVSNPEYKDV